MRRRHKIKDVRGYNTEGRAGFRLETKAGFVTLPFAPKYPRGVIGRILHFLPHIYTFDSICEQTVWDEDELKDLLIGRYLYGEVTEVEHDGMVSTTVR